MTGTLPSELGRQTELQVLELYLNDFSGSIPSEYSQLTSLEYVLVSSNRLSGSLSVSFVQWIQLKQLNISLNYFSGYFSFFSEPLLSLQALDVSLNWLSGPFSPGILGSPILFFLNISFNSFHGQLGDFYGAHSLQILDASQNRLSGTLPSSLFLIGNLTTILLFLNCFTVYYLRACALRLGWRCSSWMI
jgi:hypothetical protein